MEGVVKPVVLLIADISGYTRFMVAQDKALAHSQMVIGDLLRTIVTEARAPLAVSKLEGDAVFMFAMKDDGGDPTERARILGERVAAIFGAFSSSLSGLVRSSICKCQACSNIDRLRLKIIVHSGQAVVSQFGPFTELSGVDVVLAHRLLKNSLGQDEYLLLTQPARRDVWLPPHLEATTGEEQYDEIGTVRTFVVAGADLHTMCTSGAPSPTPSTRTRAR